MSTTTIRLTDDLKERIALVAERTGTSAHSFIVQAIAEKADLEERRQAFLDLAENRASKIAAGGKTVSLSEMKRHLEARVAKVGSASRPGARKRASR